MQNFAKKIRNLEEKLFAKIHQKKRQTTALIPMGLAKIFAKIFLQNAKFLRIFSRNVLFAANPISYN